MAFNRNNIVSIDSISQVQQLGAAALIYPRVHVVDTGFSYVWNSSSVANTDDLYIFQADGITTGRWHAESEFSRVWCFSNSFGTGTNATVPTTYGFAYQVADHFNCYDYFRTGTVGTLPNSSVSGDCEADIQERVFATTIPEDPTLLILEQEVTNTAFVYQDDADKIANYRNQLLATVTWLSIPDQLTVNGVSQYKKVNAQNSSGLVTYLTPGNWGNYSGWGGAVAKVNTTTAETITFTAFGPDVFVYYGLLDGNLGTFQLQELSSTSSFGSTKTLGVLNCFGQNNSLINTSHDAFSGTTECVGVFHYKTEDGPHDLKLTVTSSTNASHKAIFVGYSSSGGSPLYGPTVSIGNAPFARPGGATAPPARLRTYGQIVQEVCAEAQSSIGPRVAFADILPSLDPGTAYPSTPVDIGNNVTPPNTDLIHPTDTGYTKNASSHVIAISDSFYSFKNWLSEWSTVDSKTGLFHWRDKGGKIVDCTFSTDIPAISTVPQNFETRGLDPLSADKGYNIQSAGGTSDANECSSVTEVGFQATYNGPVVLVRAGTHIIGEFWRDSISGLLTFRNPGGKIVATAGFGAGNTASATTPGSCVKKMEIFDGSNPPVSLGFIPIYSSIT